MDYRRVAKFFSGKPDGAGFQEDPAKLALLFEETEAACFKGGGPQRVRLLNAWRPIGTYYKALTPASGSAADRAFNALEAYRFGEAAFGALQLIGAQQVPLINALFDEIIPVHLRDTVFGQDIDAEDSPYMQTIYRKAFRLTWTAANWDETILFMQGDEGLAPAVAEDVDYLMQLDVDALTKYKTLHVADYLIRQALLREVSDPAERVEMLTACQDVLHRQRCHFTALFKSTGA